MTYYGDYFGYYNTEKSDNYIKLESLNVEIRNSWVHDMDKTSSMKEIIEIIDGMLIMDSLEEYFLNNENDLEYFTGEFTHEVINNILMQPVVYGENGDDIALDLLYHYIKLFIKYHKNKKYSPLFEKIRKIFSLEGSNFSYFFPSEHYYQSNKISNPKKKYSYSYFNDEFCKPFINEKNEIKMFKKGDKVDVLITNSSNFSIFKKSWVRGIIEDITEEGYIINYGEEKPEVIQINSLHVLPEGTKTDDWEWRTTLQKGDIIDCFDRNKWFPATIIQVNKSESKGFASIKYRVGFRLYPEHFFNKNDYNDSYINHIVFWDNTENLTDSEGQSFFGDKENFDEIIPFYSKKIQKFNTFTAVQKENLNSTYAYFMGHGYHSMSKSNDRFDKMQLMSYYLEHDVEESGNIMEDLYLYEKNGKKNYIIGKEQNFSYYFACLLKKLADDSMFELFIQILKERPNSEEIYNIAFILISCFSYIHRDYFFENYDNIKNSYLNFIENLSHKEVRNLETDPTELVSKLILKINFLKSPNNKTYNSNELDEINLAIILKLIKTSIFDKRLQGIKNLNEYIKKYRTNKEMQQKLIGLIKKNDILNEIFGPNYHTQIISKSNDILELLLDSNELSENEIKLIWSCTKRGDLEAKLVILNLLSELTPHLNKEYIDILFKYINEDMNEKLNQNEIDLIYKLSVKANNEETQLKCFDYFCESLLITDNINNFNNNPSINKIIKFLDKGGLYFEKIIHICENSLANNIHVLPLLFLLEKIFEKFFTENKNNKFESENETLQNFVNNDNLLNLFEANFRSYKKRAKELICKNNNSEINFIDKEIINNYIIDGFTHLINMEKRINFLIKIIPSLYPKYDFIEFLNEICLINPISSDDNLFFYNSIKKYITNKDNTTTKESKEKMENRLFQLFTDGNQSEMNLSQLNLFITVFLEINTSKNFLSYNFDSKEDNYKININNDIDIDNLYGMDKLWKLLFQFKVEEVIKKTVLIIYKIYKIKDDIQNLINKCINIIKDEENLSLNILEKCIKIIRIIIEESERNFVINTKSHSSLTKECVINLPLEIPGKKNNSIKKELLFGNTTIIEIKEILVKKFYLPETCIHISLSNSFINLGKGQKNNAINKNKKLTSIDNNKSLIDLGINIDIESGKNELIPAKKIIFSAEHIPREPLITGNKISPKFKELLVKWFDNFTNGTKKMDRAACAKFLSNVNSIRISEYDGRVMSFISKYEKNDNNYVDLDGFINYYGKLISNKPETVWEHINNMNYREDLKKFDEPFYIDSIKNEKLPRYSLGNDFSIYKTLINLYNKYPDNYIIYSFLFFLSTNEKIYNELLNDFNKNQGYIYNNDNYLEQLYVLVIIKSFLQDLEVSNLQMRTIFFDKNDNSTIYELASKKYSPFDDDYNLRKKKKFLVKFIKEGNYEKMVKYVEKLLEDINNDINKKENKDSKNDNINNIRNDYDLIKRQCCEKGLEITNIIYNSFSNINNADKTNEKPFIKNGIYNLKYFNLKKMIQNKEIDDNMIDIRSIEDIYADKEIENKNCNNKRNIKDIVLQIPYINLVKNLLKFLIEYQSSPYQGKLLHFCCDTLINIISDNNTLLSEITKDESIKQFLILLIKNDLINEEINNYRHKAYFIHSLIKHINTRKNTNDDKFLIFLFEISNGLFKELLCINSNSEVTKDTHSFSYVLFFEYYSNLYKVMLKVNNNIGDDFIYKVYDLLLNDLTENNQMKKLPIDSFVGFMKILITAIKNNNNIKNKLINKEIKGNTLFNLILNKLLSLDEDINNSIMNIYSKSLRKGIENNAQNDENKFINIENIINNEKKGKSNDIKIEKLFTQEMNDIYNEYILICAEKTNDPKIIDKLLKMVFSHKKRGNKDKKDDELAQIKNDDNYTKPSKSFEHVGLKNLGCICYMNSIMQQIYMVPSFRYAIMSSDDREEPNYATSTFYNNTFDDNLLHQLQKMYTFLTLSEKQDFNPKDFCASFKDFDGAPINPLIQQDSHEFYNNFCDKIENCLKKTEFKYIIYDVFTGKTCSSVICEQCHSVSNRFEDFYGLTLEVKNIYNMNESLSKLIEPEKIDEFNCEVCKKKVTITKRTSLAKLPNVLVVHLKRFYMNYEIERSEKINSKFEFPKTLNLKDFCIEEISKNIRGKEYETDEIYLKKEEYYQYELKGINVHIGSADRGHYYSFIDVDRDGHDDELNIKSSIDNNNNIRTTWLKFNDSIISEFNTKDIPIECFGGSRENSSYENTQNAYLLIYERKKMTPIRILINEETIKKYNKEQDFNNNLITYEKDLETKILKKYDISRANETFDKNDLSNKIFFNKEKKEYYKYIPYYNLPKKTHKNIYDEVLEKNKKFIRKKHHPKEINKYKSEYNDLLFNIISSPDFDILNKLFNRKSKENFIDIFNDEIFNSNITNVKLWSSDEEKIILNDKMEILLQKIIEPLLNDNEIEYFLLTKISNILITNSKLQKIYSTSESTKIFDLKIVGKISDAIRKIIYIYNDRGKKEEIYQNDCENFINEIYQLIQTNEYYYNCYSFSSSDNEQNNNSNSPNDFIYKIIHDIILENDEIAKILVDKHLISTLLGKLTSENTSSRSLIYDTILYLIKQTEDYNIFNRTETKNNNYKYSTSNNEKEIFKRYINDKIIELLFDEKLELLIILIKILEYDDYRFSDNFNKIYIHILFNHAIKNNKLSSILDILFEIIGINDNYTFSRLPFIMGFPELILKFPLIHNDIDEDEREESKDKEEEKTEETSNEINKNNQNKWPNFGYRLLKNNKEAEIFKYVSNINLFPTHCLLAQLFPCEDLSCHDNYDRIKDEPRLTNEERVNYIYKLLSISLLNCGNYNLFKYIYMIQARSIKYGNLYEEIIILLENEENKSKFNLDIIKKNAEICADRIIFENEKIQKDLKYIRNQNIDFDDDNFIYGIDNNNEKKPDLPKEMEQAYIQNDDIEEFTGFYPEIIPDKIVREEINTNALGQKEILVKVDYYTTFKNVERLRRKLYSQSNKKNENIPEYKNNTLNEDEEEDNCEKLDIEIKEKKKNIDSNEEENEKERKSSEKKVKKEYEKEKGEEEEEEEENENEDKENEDNKKNIKEEDKEEKKEGIEEKEVNENLKTENSKEENEEMKLDEDKNQMNEEDKEENEKNKNQEEEEKEEDMLKNEEIDDLKEKNKDIDKKEEEEEEKEENKEKKVKKEEEEEEKEEKKEKKVKKDKEEEKEKENEKKEKEEEEEKEKEKEKEKEEDKKEEETKEKQKQKTKIIEESNIKQNIQKKKEDNPDDNIKYKIEKSNKKINNKNQDKDFEKNEKNIQKKKKYEIVEEEEEEEESEESESEIRKENDNIPGTRIFNINDPKIKVSEKEFLFNVGNLLRNKRKIIVRDQSLDYKKNVKRTLIRYILLHYDDAILFKTQIRDINTTNDVEHNFYSPTYMINSVRKNNIQNVLSIYRRSGKLNFLNSNQLKINISCKSENEYSNENYFDIWNN